MCFQCCVDDFLSLKTIIKVRRRRAISDDGIEKGTLELDLTFLRGEVRGARHDEEELQVLQIPDDLWTGLKRDEPFMSQYWEIFRRQSAGPRAFFDAIIGNGPASPNFYDGLKTQEVIDAALEAHERRRWVNL